MVPPVRVRGPGGASWFEQLLTTPILARATTLALALGAASGLAETRQTPPPTASASAAPAPYSLPWQLRPATAANVVRLDTSLASWDATAGDGSTWVSGVIATRKVSASVALLGRVSFVSNHPPRPGPERRGTAVSNPLLGVTRLSTRSFGLRLGLFAGVAFPIGQGGGDAPSAAAASGVARAIPTRSAMDNALFAVNYATVTAGGTIAKVADGNTFQAEATILHLFRARGPVSQDARRTNFTSGVHVGRSFRPRVSGGVELRYQRWLSDAAPVRANPSARDTLTLAIGPRLHFRLGGSRWIRPGLSLTWPLDDPARDQKYRMLQIDVPVSF
jgi:hypothetical protein